MGDPAEPVGRLVAERHQPRRFLAERARDFPASRPATMASTLSSAWLSRRIAATARVKRSVSRRERAAEDQPEQGEQDQRRADRRRPSRSRRSRLGPGQAWLSA